VAGDTGLDDYPAQPWPRRQQSVERTLAARKLGHRATRERAGVPSLFVHAFRGFANNKLEEALISGCTLIANSTELYLELLIVVHGVPCQTTL